MDRFGGNQRTARTPIWLCLVILGTAAWVYGSQSGAVAAANARLQARQAEQSQLIARQEDALAELGHAESPAAILINAHRLGMRPADWSDARGQHVAALPGGQP